MPNNTLPLYNRTIADGAHRKIIDLELQGVTLRFYPLRARFDMLETFCDKYLNFGAFSDDKPDNNRPPFSFRPALPFVLLIVLDYDRVEVESVLPAGPNDGSAPPVPETWLRQHEVIFGVPLEWYNGRGSQRQFQDWAMTAPFIYLDNPISIWIGREAFGWPKTSMRLPRLRSNFKAAEPRYLASIKIPKPSGVPDRSEVPEPFLEIFNDPTLEGTAPQITNPFSIMSSAISNYLKAASAVAASLAGVRIPNLGRPEESAAVQQMVQKGVTNFAGWLPMLSTMVTQGSPPDMAQFAQSPFMRNNITLKQFCDADSVDKACYQALVLSSVTVRQIHRAGFLFNPLSPDSSGGTVIKLHVPPTTRTHPIIETLGLETDGLEENGKVCMRILKPYFPFWYDLDLKYEPQKVLSWRGISTEWTPPNEPGNQRTDGEKASYLRIGSGVLPPRESRTDTNLTIVCLPLKARAGKLTELCQSLNDLQACSHTFTPASEYVLLSVLQFGQESQSGDPAKLDSRGLLADTEVVFSIPAKCAVQGKSERPVLLPMLGLVGAELDAFGDREIYGRLSLQSLLTPFPEKLLEDLSPNSRIFKELFTVRTLLCRALNEDEETRLWPIIDFVESAQSSTEGAKAKRSDDGSIEDWLRQLGLPMLNNQLCSLALKQFRDAQGDCTKACYQALVEYKADFSEPRYGWVAQDLALRVYEFEVADIVDYFSLETRQLSLPPRPGTRPNGPKVNTIAPYRPFWMKARLSNESARNLCCREGVGEWHDVTTQ